MSTHDTHTHPQDDDAVLAAHIEQALAAEPQTGWEFEALYQINKRLFKTTVTGAENIPGKPCLFVGNHSLFALDGWVIMPVIQKQLGRFLRSMGDRFLFENDAVSRFLLKRGAVMGHPLVCDALMEAGQDILVFPGGAHEAVKPESQLYQLQWKERYGFIKLAAKHGYTIMPFGLVGPDEFYSHLLEGSELPDSALGQLLKQFGVLSDDTRPDMLPPIPRGSLGSLLPKPQACFLGFGRPLDLSAYKSNKKSNKKGRKLSQKVCRELRAQVASEIEQQLADLLVLREQKRGSDGLLRRLLTI